MQTRAFLITAITAFLILTTNVVAESLQELIPHESELHPPEATPEETPTPTPTPTPSPTPLSEKEKARLELLKLPRSGVLSSTQSAMPRGFASQSWGDDKDPSSAPPISGGLSVSGKNLIATIKNNSKETISVSARVLQTSKKGAILKSDSLSTVLLPGKTATRSFSTRVGATGNVLEMTGWKIVSK